ncbi:MAG: transporter [Candidatus Omnitrophica bacterium]|nr:transporter [Candidatus Omnitrophota bacterium]
MKKMLSFFFSLIVFPAFAFAARPLSTNDSGTVGKGGVELEYGVEYVNGFDNEVGMGLAVTAGLFDNLDLAVEVPYAFIDAKQGSDSDGLLDISLSAKFNFIKDNEIFPDSSLSFSYKTDSANDDRGLGTGKPEYSLNGIFSKPLEPFAFHLDLGYTFKEDFEDEDNEDVFTYGLAVEYELNERINLVAEVSGDSVLKRKFHDNSCSALFGFNYSLNDNITLDFGAGTEISRADPDFKVTSGITIGL